MYELNDNLQVVEESFSDDNSKLFIIENFLKDPQEVLRFIDTAPESFWSKLNMPMHNGVFYNYQKIFHTHDSIHAVKDLMLPYFEECYLQFAGFVVNSFQLYKNDYNDYKNNYFWPHFDMGMTGVIYLNDYEGPGTNIYRKIKRDIKDESVETNSLNAWRKRDRYEVIKTTDAKYNRCVFFDGLKFMHNMAVDDDTWFDQPRLNLVVHFCYDPLKIMNK